MVNDDKYFRKGGRRQAVHNPFKAAAEDNADYSVRAKQFAAFDALKGFWELIEAAEADAEEEYDG